MIDSTEIVIRERGKEKIDLDLTYWNGHQDFPQLLLIAILIFKG